MGGPPLGIKSFIFPLSSKRVGSSTRQILQCHDIHKKAWGASWDTLRKLYGINMKPGVFFLRRLKFPYLNRESESKAPIHQTLWAMVTATITILGCNATKEMRRFLMVASQWPTPRHPL
jgi:hypothetical protein